jgi:hypothetical protein
MEKRVAFMDVPRPAERVAKMVDPPLATPLLS